MTFSFKTITGDCVPGEVVAEPTAQPEPQVMKIHLVNLT